jgi:23S rRNA (cytosine1962-C5)-methyltransferase
VAEAQLPESSEPVVVLGIEGVRRIGSGHPWLFPDHIVQASTCDGEVVRLEGPPGRPRGMATYSRGSRIPLRIVQRDGGDPLPDDWWIQRLDAAIARRVESLAVGASACRWVHAEADGLPGLVVDRFDDVAVVQAGCRWADSTTTALAEHLVATHGMTGVLARHDGPFRKLEGLHEEVRVLAGEVREDVVWKQGAISRRVAPWTGQKTGTYLDQRENQPWAAAVLPQGRCLDAFCNDGGFALHMAAAGSEVVALDSSQPALERLAALARENELEQRITTQDVNVFHDLRERVAARETFDGIVLDPPALAKRKPDRVRALRAYKELNLRALRMLRPGGRLVTCSCSFHIGREEFLGTIRDAAADARAQVVVRDVRAAAACHPRLVTFPESDYLKVVLVEVI